MNKGNLNKLVTNYPVELTEEEIANLSGTLAPVVAACGGGGGGTGGKIYTGIGFVSVNNSTNQIGLTEAANTKLNQDIPTKVSDLTDSANYQTVAGMDEYLTTGAAQNTYLTQSDAESNYAPIVTYTDVQTLKNQIQNVYTKSETSASDELSAEFEGLSAKYQAKGNYATQQSVQNLTQSVQTLTLQVQDKQNKLTYGYDENNAISSIDGTPLAGQGGTTYSAGQYINIDSNDTISVTGVLALDEYAQYEPVLIGDSNITATSSKVDSHTQWNLRINATPVTTDTTLKGENVVTAHTTQVSGEWAVGLVQSAYEAIDSVDGIATDVGTLKAASAGWNAKVDQSDLNDYLTKAQYGTDSATFALKNDIPTTVAQLTDSANYYKTNETSGATELSTEFAKYYTTDNTAHYITSSELVDSAKSATKAENLTDGTTTSSFAQITGSIDWGNAIAGHYQTHSGEFVTSSNAYISAAGEQYALTTTGWSKVQAGSTFTGVTTTGSISGGGVNNDTIGLLTSAENALTAIANKVDKPADMTSNKPYCFSGGQWADITQTYYSKTEATGTFLQKNLTNTLSGDGTSSNTLGVNWSNLSANLINSANTASNAWISGTEFSSFAQIKTAIDSKQSAGDYLPTSGGTVSGQLNISGGSNFDNQFLRFSRDGVQAHSRIGVGSNGALVFKHNNGAGQNLQMEISTEYENNAYKNGSIILKAGGTEKSKVVNVSISGANNMSAFDATNGPNYMLRKTADGFDIGACVINVTSLPAQTEANTYYFIYDT